MAVFRSKVSGALGCSQGYDLACSDGWYSPVLLPAPAAGISFNQSINQSKRKTSNANGQTNLGHKHKAPDHNHEATQPMVDLPHTS